MRESAHGLRQRRTPAVRRDHARRTRSGRRSAGPLRRAVPTCRAAARAPRRAPGRVGRRPRRRPQRHGRAALLRSHRHAPSGPSARQLRARPRRRCGSRCATRRGSRTCTAPAPTTSCAPGSGARADCAGRLDAPRGRLPRAPQRGADARRDLLRSVLRQDRPRDVDARVLRRRVRRLRRARHGALHVLRVDVGPSRAAGRWLHRRARRRHGREARDHARHDAVGRAPCRARGRVLLGAEWLERWRRSHARVPSDVPADDHAVFAERIMGLAQFRDASEPA